MKKICSISVDVDSISGPDANFNYSPKEFKITESNTANFFDLSTAGGGNITSWQWDFGDNTSSTQENISHMYNHSGTYTIWLTVTDANGCIDVTSKELIITDGFAVYIPNAFSPETDGINDGFIPLGYNIDIAKSTFIVFNRWGERIFEANDLSTPWNGRYHNKDKIVQNDVYIYYAKIKEIEGEYHEFVGRVTVVR